MNKSFPLVFLGSLLLVGCASEGGTPADENKLRATLGQKQIDFTAVPPAQRAMVLAQMRANGASAKAAELEKQWGMKQ